MPSPSGIRHTYSPSKNVRIEPIKVAAQAESRTTANKINSATTGNSAMIQVSNKLPVGLTIWMNIVTSLATRVLPLRSVETIAPRRWA
jgi:hypothetical protein